ncbi:MAG: fructose-6-phosphate aldolase, partial [Hadesarchaea archaeon]|nr:fructose-6-phosphate aldolase [Hadesarchaea archaeon]
MEIFLDTASVKEIKEILPWGIVTGVTTNQKIFLAEKGVKFEDRVREILSLVDGSISIELTKTKGSFDDLINEAREY